MTSPGATPLSATLLAAGQGSRLGGRPKASLRIGGRSLFERLAVALREAGIAELSVVIGPYREQLLPLAEACGVHVLEHARPGASLIESQRLALDAHVATRAGADLMLVLADLPLLNAVHVSDLLVPWRLRSASVHAQMPVVAGMRGHPVLLSWQAVQQIAALPRELGVRTWLAAHPEAVRPVHACEQAYVTDLDTPADLEALEARLYPEPVDWPAPAAGLVGGPGR